ncbi:MAG: hypothetical protein ABI721_01180 [Candidatus Dojkabacteria bacterium]
MENPEKLPFKEMMKDLYSLLNIQNRGELVDLGIYTEEGSFNNSSSSHPIIPLLIATYEKHKDIPNTKFNIMIRGDIIKVTLKDPRFDILSDPRLPESVIEMLQKEAFINEGGNLLDHTDRMQVFERLTDIFGGYGVDEETDEMAEEMLHYLRNV